MKITIDGKELECDKNEDISITLEIDSLSRIEKSMTGYALPFRIPITPNNMEVFGDCAEINSTQRFNNQYHVAKIEYEGTVLIEGQAYLNSVVRKHHGNGYYYMAIIGPAKKWIRNAYDTSLRKLNTEFEETIPQTIT